MLDRSVDIARYIPNAAVIRAGTRPIPDLASAILDRIDELVSKPAAA